MLRSLEGIQGYGLGLVSYFQADLADTRCGGFSRIGDRVQEIGRPVQITTTPDLCRNAKCANYLLNCIGISLA